MLVFLNISTRFASGVIRSIIDELKGIQPLKTAPPPKAFGYSRTLAKVKAPAKHCLLLLINKDILTTKIHHKMFI